MSSLHPSDIHSDDFAPDDVLAKLTRGEDADAEVRRARDAFRATLGASADAWDAAASAAPPDIELGLQRLHHTLDAQAATPRTHASHVHTRTWRPALVPMFASLAVVGAALVAGWMWTATRNDTTQLAANETAARYQEFRTRAAQRAEITLPDGSHVVLGPESHLRYRDGFGARSRDVELTGQALFTVTHHDATPFIVHTTRARVQVLGTAFVVRDYADDAAARVSVAQGRVALGDAVLGKGDEGTTVSDGRVRVSHDIDVDATLAWTRGRLVINGIRLRDAIPELERWYGITIDVADARLLDEPVITTLNTEGSREALTLLATALDARVTFTDTSTASGTGMRAQLRLSSAH